VNPARPGAYIAGTGRRRATVLAASSRAWSTLVDDRRVDGTPAGVVAT
jgi:hypothetical protein